MVEDFIKSNQDIDIDELKNDKAFKLDLESKIKIAKEEQDIVKLYEVLDLLIFVDEDEKIHEIYQLIVQLSIDYVGKTLENHKIIGRLFVVNQH